MLISVNTFWTILLIVHGLLAIALLGALTHQAMAVLMPVRQSAGGFVTRFRAVPAAGYWKTQGFFELKEHAATLGLGLLPIYWYVWKNAHDPEYDGVRKSVTALLAFICWFNFLVGHVLNNVRGFGS